ncbi:MAG TPA: hypothetical protein VK614_15050 [Allosphingosinicella sp.]|nr:hypothetical protein [Allosphingosinicella sp.]
MTTERIEAAIKYAQDQLEAGRVDWSVISTNYHGDCALAGLLVALLREVSDLRTELAQRDSNP